MFELDEIARTMAMDLHPNGGGYEVLGNKRERMAQYGNAVTPPAMTWLLERVFASIGGGGTFKDLFCGAGGSSIGATNAGGELVLGLNHWRLAIDTHSKNFPDAEHDCADVSALTTSQIRRYPDSDVFLASPECTNHSMAKGALRRKPQAASLFDDGPAGDDEQDRSRATMWDVPRFAEQKLLKGKPYKAMIVENVVDAYKWGAGDDGGLFAAWRMALTNLGYESEIVWLNSMFCPPTPQSRDRMYVVFWQKGIKKPDLEVRPVCWCPACEAVVSGRRMWKRADRPLETAKGMPVGARYGSQYLFGCPDCHSVALPGVVPAASAIDWDIPAPIIGERKKDLADSTRDRIKRGLERLLNEPFAIRISGKGYGANPKPLTLPLISLTARHDVAMVMPVAGNTFERTPGNRARAAHIQPGDTVHTTLDRAMVVPYSENSMPAHADLEPAFTQRTNPTLAMLDARAMVIPLVKNTAAQNPDLSPTHPMMARGFHHGLLRPVVMRNYTPKGSKGEMTTPVEEPFRTLTSKCNQSLVVPYQSEPHKAHEPMRTVMTHDRMALLIPPNTNNPARDPFVDPATTLTTETRCSLVEIPEAP
jgi:DNA (cytosine-5)-methyltransferase 1